MSAAVDSANLILKLYELRRESLMREARAYFFSFNPTSAQEYLAGMSGQHSAHIRMVTSYWEMACSSFLRPRCRRKESRSPSTVRDYWGSRQNPSGQAASANRFHNAPR